MSVDAPEGWRIAKLGEIASLSGGTTPSKTNDAYWLKGTIPWATPSDITSMPLGQSRIAATESHIAEVALRECSLKLNPPGTVLMTSRATIGYAAINDVPMTTNQGFLNFTCFDDCDPEFLCHWLNANKSLLTAAAGGSTFKELSRGTAKLLPILLPPLDEQRRIADVLRSVDDHASLTKRALEATGATKNATLVASLHANSWPSVSVGDLLADTRSPMRSGPFGSALLKSELTETGIPLLGIDNVHAERFVSEYRRFISEEKYQELARYTVFPDDVMVTIMGTVGRCCVVPEGVDRAISSKHVWTLTLDKARYSPALLAWQINHEPRVLQQLRGSAQGGIMSAISSETLRNLRVPLPPRAQMLELEQLILSANSSMSLLGKELAGVARLKHLISNDLLSGRVRVPA